ncbi:MAG: ADP compounds hydrolase NudE [Gammaproteobacteria bacterium]|nr:ADP compounds hydrolase NudE [Gammaproteobacteria bacterium]
MSKKPEILKSSVLATSRLFTLEQVQLEFSNGEQRTYERIIAASNGAVMIIPVIDSSRVLMIREYSVGTDRYELVFPKGLIEKDEAITDAANRELMEETGRGANSLRHIKTMTIAPGYLGFETHMVLAEDLFDKKLPGDEPESLEIVECNIDDIQALINRPDLTEARSIAALYIARNILQG